MVGHPHRTNPQDIPLGLRLSLIRKSLKLPQKIVREICHVSKATYSKWENGKSYPSLDHLVLLCRELKVSSDVLLGLQPLVIK